MHSLISEAKINQMKYNMFNDLIWFRREKKKKNGSCSMLLNDFRLPTLRTCASIPVISVPGIANTAV